MKANKEKKLNEAKEKLTKAKDCKTKEAILADIETKKASKTVLK